MAKVYVGLFYGLGRRTFSAQVEDYIGAALRLIPNVVCPPTRGYGEWEQTVHEILLQPKGTRIVVLGHSMGAAAATYCTDEAKCDLVVCYDPAGQRCSGIANNCGKLLDFQDKSFAIVPKFRPWAYPGHEKKILRTVTYNGHVRQPSDPALLAKVLVEVKKLAA